MKRVVYFGSMGEKAANVGRGITNEPNLPSSEALGINHRPGPFSGAFCFLGAATALIGLLERIR